MKNRLFKKWLEAVLCVLALGSTAALAEPDTFGLGTGRDGTLTVSTAGTNYINSYAPVTGPLAAGDTLVPVGACTGETRCFAAGDLVLVLQTTGLVPEPASGEAAVIDLNGKYKEVGRWEFARLDSVSPTSMTLTAPLAYDYAASVTQIIRVPEYTSLTINATRSITAPAWNGSTGGVVAFLAQNTFTNNGTVNANAIGFRGGRFVDDESGDVGCAGTDPDLDKPAPQGAQKGEGLAVTPFKDAHTGRGNVANGGGGGVCYKSGGGGGGNGGAGGNGGNSGDGNRPVGGLGGAAVEGSFITRLTFGGGGGSGHGDSGSTVTGGRGGGIVFIRANQLTGTGSIFANGESAGVAANDASSGGGAGGTLYLRFATSASCGGASMGARGGIGGNSGLIQVGPGGGGGGGRILFQSASGTCVIGSSNVGRASAGTQQDPSAPGGSNYGAQAGVDGVYSRLNTGFPVSLPTPTVSTPANGSVTSNRRPLIEGTARPDTDVVIYIDGVAVGTARSNSAGTYIFALPADLAERTHTVQAAIEVEGVQSPKSAANTFTVDRTPPNTVIVSGPPSPSNSRDAAFNFDVVAAEAGVTYECKLSPATTFTSCADPENFTVPADGTYTLEVRARDTAGNVDGSPASHTWTVDTKAPEARIVSGPPSLSNSRDAAFNFDVVEADTGVTYECKLSPATTFTSCADPVDFTVPADGTYTLEVRARDAAGNVGPASAPDTWTVDTKAPVARIVSGPPSPSNSRSAAFDFDVVEADTGVTYECKLSPATTFTSCADPADFTVPADGTYTLEVRARDAAGNVGPASAPYTWTVETQAPDTRIVSGPPSLSNSRNAAFDFDVVEAEAGVTYECKLSPATTFTSCTDPADFTVPADGTYTLEVRARDTVGNVDPTPATYTWTVDTVPPEVPVVESPAQNGTVDTPTPVIRGSAEPNSTVIVIIDGQVVGTTRTDASGNWSYTPTTPLTPGSHEVQVRATDEAGNTGTASAPHTFTVIQEPDNMGGDIAFLGDGLGCSATGGDSSLVLMGLGTFLALARRRRRRN